jgi:electron transfer flavoprotein alpha subunit
MARKVFAYILHKGGKADDTAFELASAAEKLAPGEGAVAVVPGSGGDIDAVCKEIAPFYREIWKIDHPSLSHIQAEAMRGMLVRIVGTGGIVLLAHEHFGMDLAPGLSVKLGAAYLPDAVAFEGIEGEVLRAVRQEYSGQVSTHLSCDLTKGAVITIRPGAFKAGGPGGSEGAVTDKSGEALAGGLPGGARRFIEMVQAEVGDVDITKADILVSVGRGIEDKENLSIIDELAEAVGGTVSCSRPIVDAKWLEKSRQVGTSGKTVKPKVYMALGISGSFQHLGGLKGSPFIVAVNKNPKAPIFQVADIGVVADILELVPELTEKINDMKG